MGFKCCGGHAKDHPNAYTNEYYNNVASTELRTKKINKILELAGKDAVYFREELYLMNKAGSKIIANNHELRSEIYDLKAKIGMLEKKIEVLSGSSSMEELERNKHFPLEGQFKQIG